MLGVVGAELWVARAGLDVRAINRVLYFQIADLQTHRATPERPFLHFALAPGTRSEGRGRHIGRFTATVNALGARGPERAADPTPGALRVLVFGGSTVYGAMVNDDQTVPARMEVALRAAAERVAADRGVSARSVEVWNFGTMAYVMPQMARLARQKLGELGGVHAVVLLVTNAGRRAFHGGGAYMDRDHVDMLSADDWGWAENLPAPDGRSVIWHDRGLRWSAVYRYFAATERAQAMPRERALPLHREMADQELRALVADAAALGVRVVQAAYPQERKRDAATPTYQAGGQWHVDLHRSGREREFYDKHPRPELLDEHARNLVAELLSAGVVSVAPPAG